MTSAFKREGLGGESHRREAPWGASLSGPQQPTPPVPGLSANIVSLTIVSLGPGMTFVCHMKISSKESLQGKFHVASWGRSRDKPVSLCGR